MPTITPTVTAVETLQGHVHQVAWGPFATGDTLTPYQNAGESDRSLHVFGTFAGATVTLQGSNELAQPSTNLAALHDGTGVAISLTAAGIVQIGDITNWIAPVITGGAATGMTALLICRKAL